MRTPKHGVQKKSESWLRRKYRGAKDIVPLFESIAGLRGAPEAMERLYTSPAYRAQLEARDMCQQVMLGYSDSVKDGGYLAACAALDRVQRAGRSAMSAEASCKAALPAICAVSAFLGSPLARSSTTRSGAR